MDANEGRRHAEDNLNELTSLKYRLMGLQGSPLYEEVPRRAHVPTTLANTNSFANDSTLSSGRGAVAGVGANRSGTDTEREGTER